MEDSLTKGKVEVGRPGKMAVKAESDNLKQGICNRDIKPSGGIRIFEIDPTRPIIRIDKKGIKAGIQNLVLETKLLDLQVKKPV